MEIVEAYFQHTSTKKMGAFLYGNCGGIFSDRAYRHSRKVKAFRYGNCNVALKFH